MQESGIIAYDHALRDRIETNLSAHERRQHPVGELRHAAVAIVLVESAPDDPPAMSDPSAEPEYGMQHLSGGAAFLLCRRASRLNAHAGQWALPGGRLDRGEDVVDAALRELDEEIGLRLDAGTVLGCLDDYPTRSGYVITPIVMWAGGHHELHPHVDEVHGVYRVGLAELCRDDSPRFVDIPESDRPVVQLPLGRFLLHAPTAAVMLQLRRVGLEGRLGERVDELEQPLFAWR